jgi:hypothetical protein
MSGNLPSSSFDRDRLYTGVIAALRIVQYLGYFAVFIFTVFVLSTPIYGAGFLGVFYIIWALTSCVFIYICTQVLIAIIDLLSRIERNTR